MPEFGIENIPGNHNYLKNCGIHGLLIHQFYKKNYMHNYVV